MFWNTCEKTLLPAPKTPKQPKEEYVCKVYLSKLSQDWKILMYFSSEFTIKYLAQSIAWGSVFNILFCRLCLCLRQNNICWLLLFYQRSSSKTFHFQWYLTIVKSVFALISKVHCKFRESIVLLSKETIKLLKVTIIDCTPKCIQFLFVSLFSAKMFSEK